MSRRTVYAFVCTKHFQPLEGTPTFTIVQNISGRGTTFKVDLTMMNCPSRSKSDQCGEHWAVRSCDHVHSGPEVSGAGRCNSMTCWNYRNTWHGTAETHPPSENGRAHQQHADCRNGHLSFA